MQSQTIIDLEWFKIIGFGTKKTVGFKTKNNKIWNEKYMIWNEKEFYSKQKIIWFLLFKIQKAAPQMGL